MSLSVSVRSRMLTVHIQSSRPVRHEPADLHMLPKSSDASNVFEAYGCPGPGGEWNI